MVLLANPLCGTFVDRAAMQALPLFCTASRVKLRSWCVWTSARPSSSFFGFLLHMRCSCSTVTRNFLLANFCAQILQNLQVGPNRGHVAPSEKKDPQNKSWGRLAVLARV